MLDIKFNYIYKKLRLYWYLLMPLVIVPPSLFYQQFYNTDEIFILFQVYDHYLNKIPQGHLFNLPYHIYTSIGLIITSWILIIIYNPFESLYENTRIFGNARWAKTKDVVKIRLLRRFGREHKDGTVICDAKIQGNVKRLFLNQPLSVLLLAPPDTGKTAGVVIPSLFLAKNSVVCLDIKGELFDITSEHRHRFSDIMVFEPTSLSTSCWNPLDESALPKEYSEKYVHMQNVAAAIFEKPKDGPPHWTYAARTLFHAIGMALIHKNGGTSISEIKSASLPNKEGQSRQDTIADLGEIEALPEEIARELRKYREMGQDQFSGETGTLDTGLIAFTDPRVAHAVSKNEIRFDELRGKKGKGGRSKTLYFKIKSEDLERLAPLIRVFFETMTNYLLSRKWKRKTEHIITYMLDEFPRLGKLKEVVKMPALSRGQGINVYLIAQDAAQIEGEYGRTGREEIMSTTAYKIVLSQNSPDTAKMISQSIGDRTIEVASSSKQHDRLTGSSSLREQGVPLIRPQEISSMKQWTCLVQGQYSLQTPVKGTLIRYFKDPELKKLEGKLHESLIYRPHIPKRAKENEAVELPPLEDILSNYDGQSDSDEGNNDLIADQKEAKETITSDEKSEKMDSQDLQEEDFNLDDILSDELEEKREEQEEVVYEDDVDKFY